MKAPKEDLNEFLAANAKPFIGPTDPPPVKLVRPSGAEKVLKPLARTLAACADKPPAAPRPYVRPEAFPGARQEHSWFMRSLAVGGGVVAMITFTILSSIFIAIFEPSDVPGTERAALPRQEIQGVSVADAPAVVEDLLVGPSELASESIPVIRRVVKRYTPVRAAQVASLSGRRVLRPRLVKSKFVPTKMIIYPENGVIKTRIESQISAYNSPGDIRD